jgi:hypothetical protein
MDWSECYYDHFANFLKEPSGRELFDVDTKKSFIQVLTYDSVFKGCRVFCTIGLTLYQKELNNICEVFLPTDEGWDQIPYILSNALYYMVRNQMTLHRGSCLSGIENIQPSFARLFNKTALYFATPFGPPESFNRVGCNKQTGKVYLAAFISGSEFNYLTTHGVDLFEELLEAKEVDPFILSRQSAI